MQRSCVLVALVAGLGACAGILPGAPLVTAAPRAGGPIEVGCSMTAMELRGEVGSVHDVICPAHCTSGPSLVAGTDVYIDASSICASGVHAGAIPETGGRVTLRIEPGQKAYRGSVRYGVRSVDFGAAMRSFSLLGVARSEATTSTTTTMSPPSDVIEAGCSFTGAQIEGDVGQAFEVACPASCTSEPRLIAGTDLYIDASAVCAAGIHAGAIPPGGGRMIVRLEPGRKAYRGSTRNGLTSNDFGEWRRSMSLAARH